MSTYLRDIGRRRHRPTVHTPEGMPLPPNALAELQRDMARLGFVVSQIRKSRKLVRND